MVFMVSIFFRTQIFLQNWEMEIVEIVKIVDKAVENLLGGDESPLTL